MGPAVLLCVWGCEGEKPPAFAYASPGFGSGSSGELPTPESPDTHTEETGTDPEGTDTGRDTAPADTAPPEDTAPPVDSAVEPICTPMTCTRRLTGTVDLPSEIPQWAVLQGQAGWGTGYDVDAVGDVDGDGLDDLLVFSAWREIWAPYGYGTTGIWSLAVGSVEGVSELDAASVTFYREADEIDDPDAIDFGGGYVWGGGARGGDLDSDGIDDLLLSDDGAYPSTLDSSLAGVVWVVSGPIGPAGGRMNLVDLPTRIMGVDEALADDAIGGADLTGDGLPDLVTLNNANLLAGHLDIFAGPIPAGWNDSTIAVASIWADEGNTNAFALGTVDVGDADGDGVGDLLVGAPTFVHDDVLSVGALALFRGPELDGRSLSEADHLRHGTLYGESVGRWMAMLGDTDGDGTRELACGEDIYQTYSFYGQGHVYVFSGDETGSGPIAEAGIDIHGREDGDGAYAVNATAGDLDGDGFGDLVYGAIKVLDSGEQGGYIVYGPLPPGASEIEDVYGAAIECGSGGCAIGFGSAGDMDGDGYEDLFVGQPGEDRVDILLGGLEPM